MHRLLHPASPIGFPRKLFDDVQQTLAFWTSGDASNGCQRSQAMGGHLGGNDIGKTGVMHCRELFAMVGH